MKRLLGLLMMGVVGFIGCGGDKDTPTGPTQGPEGQTLEVWTEKWDNGNVKEEYHYFRDIEGKVVKHGYYKEYDKDGTLRVDGTYFEDKEKYNGKWVSYYEDGQIEWERNYKDGKYDGKWVKYYSDGQIKYEKNYKDGIEDGKWVGYYSDGQIEREENYKDGKLDGKYVKYDEEGNINYEYCYEMGVSVDCP